MTRVSLLLACVAVLAGPGAAQIGGSGGFGRSSGSGTAGAPEGPGLGGMGGVGDLSTTPAWVVRPGQEAPAPDRLSDRPVMTAPTPRPMGSSPVTGPEVPPTAERPRPLRRRPETEQIVPEGVGADLQGVVAPPPPRLEQSPTVVDGGPTLSIEPVVAPATRQPASARQAQERDAAAIAACDAAKFDLRVVLYKAANGRPPDLAALQARAAQPGVAALLEAHDRACLQSVAAAPAAGTEAARVAALLAALRPRLGAVFVAEGAGRGKTHCTGLLLDHRHVATARHCIYASTPDAAPHRIRIGFVRWIEPEQQLAVTAIIEDPAYGDLPFEERQRRGDFLLLRLDPSVEDTALARPMPMATPRAFQRVTLVGLQTLLGVARDGQPPGVVPSRSWSHLLRHEVRADCRIAWTTPRGCFFYGCNAEAGWSGGPVLAIPDDTGERPAVATLLGVHTGAIDGSANAAEQTDCGSAAELAGLPRTTVNLGAPIPGWIARTLP